MGAPSERARAKLLDAAEELFALHGIDAVSSRRIAEHAGSANHSAVAYHFGTREELIRTLVERYSDVTEQLQNDMIDELPENPSLLELVRCRLLPVTQLLERLPKPSFRAQFLAQALANPSAVAALAEQAMQSPNIANFDLESIPGVPVEVARSRSAILGQLVLGVCARFEVQEREGTEKGTWHKVGMFLADAATGMLAAPVSDTAHSIDVTDGPQIV